VCGSVASGHGILAFDERTVKARGTDLMHS
jgi:hypothetical protein